MDESMSSERSALKQSLAIVGARRADSSLPIDVVNEVLVITPEELDLTSLQGLRGFHRNLILQEPSTEILIQFFPRVLESALRADRNLEWQLASLDALSIWLLRATRTSNPSQLRAQITELQWQSLISLTWVRWTSAPNVNSVHKCLREIFSKILVLQRLLFPDWNQREADLLDVVFTITDIDLKVQCHLIEILVRRVSNGAHRLLETRKSWVTQMLEEMKDGGVGPTVGKCLVCVLTVLRSELLEESAEDAHSRWVETWKDPLLRMIAGSDEGHIRVVNKYFLPILSKECPTAFVDLLQNMANDIFAKKETSELQIFMLCLNIARRSKLLPDDRSSHASTLIEAIQAFTDLGLPETFFPFLLTNASPTIRLSAFDILTFHAQQKTPISQGCYRLIQAVLPSLFAEQDGEFRIEILRSTRVLLMRLRASTHSTVKELEKRASKLGNIAQELNEILTSAGLFIGWLVHFCKECITPGRSYYTASMGLRTLYLIGEEGLFTDLKVEVKSGVSSGVRVELFSHSMLRLLVDRLADPYDEVSRLAYGLLERIKDPEMMPLNYLFSKGRELCSSGRADKSEGGAKVLCLCQQFGEANGYKNVWEELWGSLVYDIETGNLRSVAEESPLHGRLIALRLIPQTTYRNVVKMVLDLCSKIWDLVSPVLTNDSPEGNLYVMIDVEPSTTSALRDATAQDLLSSSWRSLKEASSLLGTVLASSNSSYEDYQAAGTLFIEWLTRIRHRGAFSAVMPSFESLCSECFKYREMNVKNLPGQWLNKCLSSIREKTRSITRRSGGLPMLITAILVAEADMQSFELTKLALSQLLTIAEAPVDSSGMDRLEPAKWDLPQVHAQNAMKAIFTESRLSHTAIGYIEPAFDVAIKGFGSDVYPIRNSSIMFFDALLQRALGQKYARQDIDLSASNRSVSSKVFFTRFPKLRGYLLEQLTQDVALLENNKDIVNSGLYPILTLISRLDVTKPQDSNKYTGMHAFRPFIQRCMTGKIWKVRAMAARCLPVVLEPDNLSDEISKIFSSFRLDAQNELHGGLMGIKHLAEFYSYRTLSPTALGRSLVYSVNLDAILNGLEEILDMIMRDNTNPLTKAAYVEIVQYLLGKENSISPLMKHVFRICLNDIHANRISPVGSQLYLERATSLVLSCISNGKDPVDVLPEDVLEILIQNENEEVITQTVSWVMESGSNWTTIDKVRKALLQLLFRGKWDRIRALALQTISIEMCSEDFEDIFGVGSLHQIQKEDVRPVQEGKIVLAGHVTRLRYMRGMIDEEGLELYLEVLSDFVQPRNPESTRYAVLRSLENFLPVLSYAASNPSATSSIIPSFFVLLLLLCDDSDEIRARASEITSTLLGEHVAFTPMIASDKLAQLIGETFDPQHLEKRVIKILCQSNIRQEVRVVSQSSSNLFAKERQNVWRDEVYEFNLYIKIISECWSRQMNSDTGQHRDDLVEWIEREVVALNEVVELHEDVPLGWSHEKDVFEGVMKLFMVMEALLRYGRARNSVGKFEELERTMTKRESHEYWVERIRDILSTV